MLNVSLTHVFQLNEWIHNSIHIVFIIVINNGTHSSVQFLINFIIFFFSLVQGDIAMLCRNAITVPIGLHKGQPH